MKKNYLIRVSSLYNTDAYTVLEIETYFFKRMIKIPYTVIKNINGIADRYEYKYSLKQYCKEHNIEYSIYF